MDRLTFEKELKQMFSWVNEKTFVLFEQYKSFLQSENKKINLTRLADENIIYENYFLESLIPFSKINLFHESITFSLLDIGSGSGIPGIALKIIFKDLKVVLLDSNNKKVNFLNKLITFLNLKDVSAVCQRAEEYIKTKRCCFDIVTSRAVSELRKILELSTAFAKIDGYIIQPKSLKAQQELDDAKEAINKLNLVLTTELNYSFLKKNHHIFVFKKRDDTSLKYPRKWSQILKDPL